MKPTSLESPHKTLQKHPVWFFCHRTTLLSYSPVKTGFWDVKYCVRTAKLKNSTLATPYPHLRVLLCWGTHTHFVPHAMPNKYV